MTENDQSLILGPEKDRTIIVVEESADFYKMQKKVQLWLRNEQKYHIFDHF